jgi:hypothetical protein
VTKRHLWDYEQICFLKWIFLAGIKDVGCEDFTAVTMKIAVFGDLELPILSRN